jgi:hypothetical protein
MSASVFGLEVFTFRNIEDAENDRIGDAPSE